MVRIADGEQRRAQAYLGWQLACSIGGFKQDLSHYQRLLGIDVKLERDEADARREVEDARANAAKVREAFRKRIEA